MTNWHPSKGDYIRENAFGDWKNLQFSWRKRVFLEYGLIVVRQL
ncbi:MAG: hypothetical protein ABIG69_05765 [Bacteroidota bacterium]